jgi:hypothetical protein
VTDSTIPSDRPAPRALPWVAPFVVFLALLAILPQAGLPPCVEAGAWFVVLVPLLWFVSRDVIALRPTRPLASALVGVGVFALWVAPDLLVSGWRDHWLFQNGITGSLRSSLSQAERTDPVVLALRTLRAALLVPIVEELFWRGWLPRWIQDPRFDRVPLGRYTPLAFLVTAVLFAAEHGPFWEVGLLAGVAYNLWMWRTRSLGDLILAHAVTNAVLSGFVLVTGRWALWL